MLTIKQVLRIAIILAIISAILGYIYYKCPITFKSDLKVGDVVTILLNFGVIAILVQRFATQFLLKDSYYQFMAAHKMKGYGTFVQSGKMKTQVVPMSAAELASGSTVKTQQVVMTAAEEAEESKKEFKQLLFWVSWGIGMIIAAIGFRFFNNVIAPSTCTGWHHAEITVILDVFMTGILLSGGSALIMQIIMWWKSDGK